VGDGLIEGTGDGDGPMDGEGDALTTLRLNTASDPAHEAMPAQRQSSTSAAMARKRETGINRPPAVT
jgi:hypothetical protein